MIVKPDEGSPQVLRFSQKSVDLSRNPRRPHEIFPRFDLMHVVKSHVVETIFVDANNEQRHILLIFIVE